MISLSYVSKLISLALYCSVLLFVIVSICLSVRFFFFQAEDGIRDLVRSRGLGDVYKRQDLDGSCLIVHVLDGRTPYWQSLQLLESHIARLTLSLIHI